MKIFLLILIVLLFSIISNAQESRTPLILGNPECGDPMVESQLYDNREGKIVKILGANRILFQQKILNGNKRSGEFIVNLLGIDSKTNSKEVINFLRKYILNKEVEITGTLRKKSDKEFSGLIFVESDNEEVDWINENLLARGIAKYKPFESNNLVSYTKPCELQKAQERAKQAKSGIWAKNNFRILSWLFVAKI